MHLRPNTSLVTNSNHVESAKLIPSFKKCIFLEILQRQEVEIMKHEMKQSNWAMNKMFLKRKPQMIKDKRGQMLQYAKGDTREAGHDSSSIPHMAMGTVRDILQILDSHALTISHVLLLLVMLLPHIH